MIHTLITGASSGLGKEFAVQCARRGMNLLLLALPGGNTQTIADNLAQEYKIDAKIFELDLTNSLELQSTVDTITAQYNINFLINNAGMGGTSLITETSLERIDQIIQLNVRSLAMLTRMLLPQLLKNGNSYIMNISSMAAFVPIAYKTVYPASKAFISSFSLGLREELKDQGLSVSVVYPGPIMTNYNTSERILAQGLKGKIGLLPTAEIAAIAVKQTLAGKATIIPGLFNKISQALMTFLPLGFQLRLVSGQVKNEVKYAIPA
ncbi:MAG: SDR family NAD(P)-dependent oxidoreductase [Sphingobacteriales bacterium]|nr:MAG: SDR family NAD(P)-dependent oxidoreductase [Sphingobacteriales bacterium]